MLYYLPQVFIFIFGLAIGSFLNVCILRIPAKKKISEGRSECPECQNKIRFYDNFPVLSWVLLGGKCRNCKNPISKIYPFGELLTGILFLTVFYKFGLTKNLPEALIFVSVLLVVSFIDFEHQIIPNVVLLIGTVMIFMSRLILGFLDGMVFENLLAFLLGGGFGIGIIAFHFFLFFFLTKKAGFGMGDFKLMFFLGGFLGGFKAVVLFFLASFIGIFIFLVFKLLLKREISKFAFGPSLCLAAYCLIFIETKKIVGLLT
ncbi:prepilin peptidase [bacterium]|nr:prepilin peptidase [bacterium]